MGRHRQNTTSETLPAVIEFQADDIGNSLDWLIQKPSAVQQVLVLRMLGYSVTEIAEQRGVSSPAVSQMISYHAPKTGLPALTHAQANAILEARWRHEAHRALDHAATKREEASYSAAIIGAAVSTDKAAALHATQSPAPDMDSIEVRLRMRVPNRARGALGMGQQPTNSGEISNS